MVVAAMSPGDSNLVPFCVENKRLLSHECATEENLVRPTGSLCRKAVPIVSIPVQILTGEPAQVKSCFPAHAELKYGVAHEVGEGTVRVGTLIVAEAYLIVLLRQEGTLAVVRGVKLAKPSEVILEKVEKSDG